MPLNNHVRVVCVEADSSHIALEFDRTLQTRGTDFKVYFNSFRSDPSRKTGDSDLLQWILLNILDDNTGVESVEVRPYRISINKSAAVSNEEVVRRVEISIRNAGMVLAS